MATTRLSALSDDARRQVERSLGNVRKDMDGREYGISMAENVRSESMNRMLSLVAPCLRRFMSAEAGPGPDGSRAIGMEVDGVSYELRLSRDRNRRGEAVETLVVGEPRDGYIRPLFNAEYHGDGTDKPWASGHGRLSTEAEALSLLDAMAPRLQEHAGELNPGVLTRFTAEVDMVAADGNLVGATCREFLEALRNEMVRGGLERVSRDLPGLAAAQAEAGYAWGERYLAYNDTDIRSCCIPVPGAVACLHENVDLADDPSRWVVAVEPDGRVSVWGYTRGSHDTRTPVDAAVSEGIAALGQPDVSFDPATGTVTNGGRDFDVCTLVANVSHALGADTGTFANLAEPSEDDEVEARTDFGAFSARMSEFEDEWDEPEDAASSLSP